MPAQERISAVKDKVIAQIVADFYDKPNGKIIESIFGGAKPPPSAPGPSKETKAARDRAKKARTRLFETGGEQVGEEVGSVAGRRNTLLGN